MANKQNIFLRSLSSSEKESYTSFWKSENLQTNYVLTHLIFFREQLQSHVQYIEDNLYSFQNILAGGNYNDPGMLDVGL